MNWRDRLMAVSACIFVVLMLLSAPIGIGMALYTNNGSWFWLCAAWIIFLS
jgi:hypothetical protein